MKKYRLGFTLIELLVVVAIITLLIGILIPSLSAAKENANAAKCASNMRSLTQAMALYSTEFNQWLAGPHTSGAMWTPGLDSIGPAEASGREAPVQNMDWVSPTLGRTTPLADNDVERLKQIYNVKLYCPSNSYYFTDTSLNNEGVTMDAHDFRYMSYAATIYFHAWPSSNDVNVDVTRPDISSLRGPAIIRPGYSPKLTNVGNPSSKAYLVEGSRYVAGEGALSLNLARYQIQGGNFMIVPPWMSSSDTPYTLPSAGSSFDGALGPLNKSLAWRHKDKMNLAFFDGHVEKRPVADTIQASLYFPSGSQISPGASGFSLKSTYDKNNAKGMEIP